MNSLAVRRAGWGDGCCRGAEVVLVLIYMKGNPVLQKECKVSRPPSKTLTLVTIG